MRNLRLVCEVVGAAGLVLLSGCGSSVRPGAAPASGAAVVLRGTAHGGQQPLALAKIYLYAVSTTADGGPASSLLTSVVPGQPGFVLTDVNGNWSITGDYSCPAGANVYLLAVGGNPGLGGSVNNTKLVLATGLGACSGLSASSFFTINEATTVAMAYAFAGFESSSTQIGSATALNVTNAFTAVSAYVDPVHGLVKSALPASDTIRQTIDSLSNSIAACVNSDGTGSACSGLLTDTTVAAGAPADTFQAAMNVVTNPTSNVTAIYNLGGANGPFQPTLPQAPTNWIVYAAPSFFTGQVAVGNGSYTLTFPGGGYFGTYSYMADPHYVTLTDLGAEYVTDPNDGTSGIYLYDLASNHRWYTSPTLYPYLYDFQYGGYLYYFTGTTNPRVFYNFTTNMYMNL